MNIIAIIPARFAASRFPGKLLQPLGNKSVLATTYLSVKNSGIFDDVIVATDDDRIVKEIQQIGGNVRLTSKDHQSGSDRIAEVVKDLEVDIIVNVQGDEPFTEASALMALKDAFEEDINYNIDVATLKERLQDKAEISNPNNVKVVTDQSDFALYFSRSVIPFDRDQNNHSNYYKHIGIYAYRKKAILAFTALSQSPLEKLEKLEQLRYLENGYKIKVIETDQKTIGIDTPEDLKKAQTYLNSKLKQ